MSLASGSYLPRVKRDVIVWRRPDANGPGEALWENELDPQGRVVGQVLVRDRNGNEVRPYPAPEGFRNIPNSDRVDSYTYFKNGELYRQPNGEAVIIQPGQALVFEPDGSVTVLPDEYAQYLFSLAHDPVSGAVVSTEE